jgi:pathogenesis-related protein 1
MLFPSFVLSLAALALAAPQPESKRDTTSKADIAKWLDPHNALRAQHGAKPLVWNSTLADYANNWAGKCVFQHSGGPYGECIASGGEPANITGEVAMWTAEACT